MSPQLRCPSWQAVEPRLFFHTEQAKPYRAGVRERPLSEVVQGLLEFSEGVRRPWTPESPARVHDAEQPGRHDEYLLEVELAQEVVEVWSLWRGGRHPTALEAVNAVIHYAEHDAYQPVQEEAPRG